MNEAGCYDAVLKSTLQKMTGEVLQDLAVQSMQDWMSAAETLGHPCMRSKYFYAQSLTHAN